MSGAIYRVRKRIAAEADHPVVGRYESPDWGTALEWALNIIDEEIEKDAEKEFTTSIKPVEFTG